MTTPMLDHINIRTAKLAESIDFYGGAIGLRMAPPPTLSDMDRGAYGHDAAGHPVLHLVATDHYVDGSGPVRGAAQPGMIDHFALSAADPEAYATRLSEAGLSFERMDVPMIGRHLIFVRDPNGIMVELGFPLAEEQDR